MGYFYLYMLYYHPCVCVCVCVIQIVEFHKVIFASTDSKIYRVPLARCGRHNNACSACMRSRDPYCVWNTDIQKCEVSSLTANGANQGAVPSK